LPTLRAYAELLATVGVERGLIGPREVPRLWDRHMLNSAVVTPLLGDRTTVADLGSGAGLPGIVLAAQRPDCRVVLVEPLLRRATFLGEAVQALGLSNVTVQRARAEALHGHLVVDTVTARAVAPLERLAGWALPLLRPGGRLLAIKGRSAAAELSDAAATLRALGATSWELAAAGDTVGEGTGPETGQETVVVTVVAGRPTVHKGASGQRARAAGRLDGGQRRKRLPRGRGT
jgi:16S rRNA (guanine527-N7)-methyltransferase